LTGAAGFAAGLAGATAGLAAVVAGAAAGFAAVVAGAAAGAGAAPFIAVEYDLPWYENVFNP
jgi:hypothetical protein